MNKLQKISPVDVAQTIVVHLTIFGVIEAQVSQLMDQRGEIFELQVVFHAVNQLGRLNERAELWYMRALDRSISGGSKSEQKEVKASKSSKYIKMNHVEDGRVVRRALQILFLHIKFVRLPEVVLTVLHETLHQCWRIVADPVIVYLHVLIHYIFEIHEDFLKTTSRQRNFLVNSRTFWWLQQVINFEFVDHLGNSAGHPLSQKRRGLALLSRRISEIFMLSGRDSVIEMHIRGVSITQIIANIGHQAIRLPQHARHKGNLELRHSIRR